MNYQIIRNIIGKIMILLALLMCLPLIVCIVYQEELINYIAFTIPISILLIIGVLFTLKKADNKKMLAKEWFIIVGVSWLIMSLFGCLPFIISGVLSNPFDAFFEITSGFTTTGATVISNPSIEELLINNHSIMFWRSFSHWIGGMGVLVFILMIIPESDEGSAVHILRAESPGPQVGRLVTKMKASSRILYLIYIGLTLIQVILLWAGPDMDLYSSLIHSFGTAGTGGFSISNISIEAYSSYSQYVIAVFMIIFGINFTMYYFILIGNFKDVLKNEEIKWYFGILIASVVLVCISIFNRCANFEETFRLSLFQVASIISTTGYSTTNFATWPSSALIIIFILMFMGSCAGSTAGGIKCSRIVIIIKSAIRKLKAMINPRKVETIRVDKKPITDDTISSVHSFVIVYIVVFLLCAIIVSFDPMKNNDFTTSLTASLACISNIGPGLGAVGPYGSFAEFNGFTKFLLSLEMIAGRLELFPLLILFNPKTWRIKRM